MAERITEPTNGNVQREKVRRLEEDVANLKEKIDDLETRLTKNEVELARLSERLTVAQAIQGAFTVLAATIASVVSRGG